jgi:hypothetical protein
MNCRVKYSTFMKAFLSAWIAITPAVAVDAAELQSATLKAWSSYVEATERRIASELKSTRGFLALDFQAAAEAQRERRGVLAGEITVKKMETADPGGEKIQVLGGMIHHWRGSVFIGHVDLDQILSRVTNPAVADTRQEDVLQSRILERGPDSLRIFLKLQRSKFITVVFNTEHQVQVHRHGKTRASSTSVATRIAELDMPNSDREQEKPLGQDRGFLWRLNSYWRYEQVPGGVIVECESLSLSRTVPSLLEPVIRPLIDSTARESMQRTLGSMRGRLTNAHPAEPVLTPRGDGTRSRTKSRKA